jgi:hypothetical protein
VPIAHLERAPWGRKKHAVDETVPSRLRRGLLFHLPFTCKPNNKSDMKAHTAGLRVAPLLLQCRTSVGCLRVSELASAARAGQVRVSAAARGRPGLVWAVPAGSRQLQPKLEGPRRRSRMRPPGVARASPPPRPLSMWRGTQCQWRQAGEAAPNLLASSERTPKQGTVVASWRGSSRAAALYAPGGAKSPESQEPRRTSREAGILVLETQMAPRKRSRQEPSPATAEAPTTRVGVDETHAVLLMRHLAELYKRRRFTDLKVHDRSPLLPKRRELSDGLRRFRLGYSIV